MTAAAAVLIGDIGGTNARFALVADGRLHHLGRRRVADFADPESALRDVLGGVEATVAQALLAVAGPVSAGGARLTNGAWSFDPQGLARELKLARVELINDFAAQALALPALGRDDLVRLAGPATPADAGGMRAVLGPGTGLGVAALLPDGRPLVGEGGHATLAARTDEEWDTLRALQRSYGHVSAERALSGMGLVDLHAVHAARLGAPACRSAAEVTAAAAAGEPAAEAALSQFFAFLGTVAGDVALTFGALGGVYLAGGILPRLVERARASDLSERFLSKGRFQAYLEGIPLHLVVHPEPALLGLAHRARALEKA
jgi:glucokinase